MNSANMETKYVIVKLKMQLKWIRSKLIYLRKNCFTVIEELCIYAGSDEKGLTTTHYTAAFDDEEKRVTIEGISDTKKGHDFIYLTLEEVSSEELKLIIEVEINTGIHFISKAVGALLSKPMEQIMCKHIYQNFEALCTGKETKRMSKEELDSHAKDIFS